MNSVKRALTQNISLLQTLSMLLVGLMVFFCFAPVNQTEAGLADALGMIFGGAATAAAAVGFVVSAPVSVPATVVAVVGLVGVSAGGGMVGLGVGGVLEEVFGDSSR